MSLYRQDMPPSGGYASIRTARMNKPKGLSTLGLMTVAVGMITYGLGRYIYYQRQENEIRMARVEERTAYAPIVKKFLVDREKARDAAVFSAIDAAVQQRREKLAADVE